MTMPAASRQARAGARARLEELIGRVDTDTLERLAADLRAAVELLDREHTLRRHLADPTSSADARRRLVTDVFGPAISELAADTLRDLVAERWSRPVDLLDAAENLADEATLAIAERADALDTVEDELFRFGRILADQRGLREALSDTGADPDRRIGLLGTLLADRAHPVTVALFEHLIRSPRGRNLEVAATALAELAAGRRARRVAHVTSAVPLDQARRDRLAATLRRIYRRDITLWVDVDPDLLGGLVIRVGDEIIDGSVAGRLDQARSRLAG